jgi:hypothetical protein
LVVGVMVLQGVGGWCGGTRGCWWLVWWYYRVLAVGVVVLEGVGGWCGGAGWCWLVWWY